MPKVKEIAESLIQRILNDIFFEIGEIFPDFPSDKDRKRGQNS